MGSTSTPAAAVLVVLVATPLLAHSYLLKCSSSFRQRSSVRRIWLLLVACGCSNIVMAHRAEQPQQGSSSIRMGDDDKRQLLASSLARPSSSSRDEAAAAASRRILVVSQSEEQEDLGDTTTTTMEGEQNSNNSKRIKLAEKDDAAASSRTARGTTTTRGRTPLTCKKKIASLLLREAGIIIPPAEDDDTNKNDTMMTKKRTDYISFDDYFMATAVLSSHRSKDPVNATGACIVDSSSNRIIGTGYNGFPVGCSDDVLPWWGSNNNSNTTTDSTTTTSSSSSSPSSGGDEAQEQQQRSWLRTRSPYTVTAEVNAILNKVTTDCTNARLYTQQFPNADSAKVIIQSGISEVVYNNTSSNDGDDEDADSIKASRILLTLAGVRMRRYQPAQERVVLDFTKALDASDLDSHTSSCSNNNNTEGETKVSKDAVDLRNKTNVLEHRDLLLREANYDPLAEVSGKRNDALSWDDYFLSMAFLAAQRSKDPNTQVGACIVDANKRIVGLGYNGFPVGCSDDDLPWARHSERSELHKKYVYVCHAEMNAVMNKGGADVRGATLYVALFPCNECAKIIVQAGIREVVFMSDRYHDTDACKASRILFQMTGVRMRRHIPSPRSICIQLATAKESLDSSNSDQ